MTSSIAQNYRLVALPSVRAGAQTVEPSHWILNPVADILMCCGGVVWMLFAYHYVGLSGSDHGIAAGLITASAIGALFLSEGHTAATLVRAYGKEELREGLYLFTYAFPLLFAALAFMGTVVPGVAPVLVKLYLLIVPQHFMAQSYGIARLYCAKRKYTLGRYEMFALQVVTWMTIAFATLRQLTYKDWSGTTFLGQEVPMWGPLPEAFCISSQLVLMLAVVAFLFIQANRASREQRFMPLPALLTMATGVAAFTMGQAATGIYWLYVSAFFHATQYLAIVITTHLKETRAKESPRSTPMTVVTALYKKPNSPTIQQRLENFVTSPLFKFCGLILLVSVFLYLGTPRILAEFGFNYSLAAAAIFSCINLHHAMIDSVMWKLRKKEVREALV